MKKVNHLIQLPKAETNLTLWKADLTQEGSFDEAIEGCHGVFHVATPMDFESKDPEVSTLVHYAYILILVFIYLLENDRISDTYINCRMKS